MLLDNFNITCIKCCKADTIDIQIIPYYTDDPSDVCSENHYWIVCKKCGNREKIFIPNREAL